jgi:flagellar motor switch protein FliM
MQETGAHDYMKMKAREKLLDGAGISVDRMPLLHVIFERMAGQCSESLRQLSASPALFLVESVITERIGDVLDGCESDVVFGIIYVQAWDSRLLYSRRRCKILSRPYVKQSSNWTVSRQGSISSPWRREPHSG